MVRDNGSMTILGARKMSIPQITFDHIEDNDEKKEVPFFLEEPQGIIRMFRQTGVQHSWSSFNLSCPASPVKKNLDGPSIGISRGNSLSDDMDYVSEDTPLPVVTDASHLLTSPLMAKVQDSVSTHHLNSRSTITTNTRASTNTSSNTCTNTNTSTTTNNSTNNTSTTTNTSTNTSTNNIHRTCTNTSTNTSTNTRTSTNNTNNSTNTSTNNIYRTCTNTSTNTRTNTRNTRTITSTSTTWSQHWTCH
ncbi:uncharacterized protein YBL113C-like [Oncorhynchus tshawytscha]|uniref:uncharacterized protein YBL113C-like n=1 Tax=Oncorhynchus tshawytscha TaxID=74940 RepID=UPI001C3CF1B0|nr:uncharacterized protein YBL113C-like [Oncorhynchus tshawytscha]